VPLTKQFLFSSQREDEIEDYFKKKYVDKTNMSVATSHLGEGDEEMVNEIRQQSLLPNIKDPNLWIIKCRIGEEKSTALLLMRKFLTYQSSSK